MKSIRNYKQLNEYLRQNKDMFVLLHKGGSQQSICAYNALNKVMSELHLDTVFTVDITISKDIHPEFNIHSVPVLLAFSNGKLKNMYKGCQPEESLKGLFGEKVKNVLNQDKNKHIVTVYSTLACSWCNTLKSYLRQNGISFRDIDVSKDERAAAEMVRRSGQQGVPQSIIDGNLVIGFDKSKIDTLLEINNN